MQLKNQEQFNEKVKQYVLKYAVSGDLELLLPAKSEEKLIKKKLDPSIDQLSDTSDIELVQLSDDEEAKS